MAKKVSLIGNRYGRLTVIAEDSVRKHRTFWKCQCDCGNTTIRRGDLFKDTSSCGCLKSEMVRERMTIHGDYQTSLYSTWHGMIGRCTYSKVYGSRNYLGKGIEVYEPWRRDYAKFKDYVSKLEHFGEKGYTLDRIDVNGNYEPNNVRWASTTEQALNKSTNHFLTCNGKTQTVKEWSNELHIPPSTLHERLRRGWSDEDTLLKPIKKKHKKVS